MIQCRLIKTSGGSWNYGLGGSRRGIQRSIKANPSSINTVFTRKRLTNSFEVARPWSLHTLNNRSFCSFGFLTSSSTTRLYRGRAPRQSVWQFYALPYMRQSWETMTSVSAGHIILTPTQPVRIGRPQREWNPVPPHEELRALPTELPRPRNRSKKHINYLLARPAQ